MILTHINKLSFEDDCSVHSTITVEHHLPKHLEDDEQSLNSFASTSKSVRFNTDDNQEYENTQLCFEETADLWCSSSDYKRFRSHTMALAAEVAKAEAKNRAPLSYERVLLRTYEACSSAVVESEGSVLSSDERRHLARWAEAAPSRLGLERWAIKRLGRERTVRRAEIVDTVLDLQQLLQTDNADECIRKQSERISRTSRLMARCMAQAHAQALEKEC